MLKTRIDQDLKIALLAGDKVLVSTLRGLKSAILYEEVAKGLRDSGLPDDEVIIILSRELKKRQESADLYVRGGNQERAEAELQEKMVIERYLPKQLSDDALIAIIDKTISGVQTTGMAAMGQVIANVKKEVGATAEGSRIAKLVKERL